MSDKRSRKNKPANQRYKAESRWAVNKKKRVEKEARKVKENSCKKLATPRGSARAVRRAGLNPSA